ncbi:MAG TPA: hypothetical protein VN519_05120 [Bryobacteraceae bacterium]|nr:hypothetical protein [Bryobacteraceae bacterium]
MADKVRMWFDRQQIGGAVNNKNIDLAPDGKRMMPPPMSYRRISCIVTR